MSMPSEWQYFLGQRGNDVIDVGKCKSSGNPRRTNAAVKNKGSTRESKQFGWNTLAHVPLLTPPPSSSPPKTPIRSYSAQTHSHAGAALRQLTMHISTNDLHCCKPARLLQRAPSGGRPRRPPATAPPRIDPPHQQH